jgi:hypothetical protein
MMRWCDQGIGHILSLGHRCHYQVCRPCCGQILEAVYRDIDGPGLKRVLNCFRK